jgi:hypothetical protein
MLVAKHMELGFEINQSFPAKYICISFLREELRTWGHCETLMF